MRNFLRICDIYGENFHWYIGFKPKYYTIYGGIFSILSLISIFVIFLVFGYDDFERKIPISNTSSVPPSGYKNIKFGEKKLYLPWRIIDYDENAINISGIIYPRIYYFTVHPDNKTGELITKYNLINYKLCNETSMKYLGEEYIIDIPIDTLYCIDMEDLNVGGSWNTDFLNFIRFDLYMCEDGIDYNETNKKCTKHDDLRNIYGKGDSVFFELLYPVIQFQPTNLQIPILILYKTHYYIFNKFSNRLERMYLQEHVFEDDKNWLFNRPINISYWGINEINGESYIIGEKDVLRFASTSKLYTLNIYFELGIVYYTRKYKKLYEILGEIFPIISAVCSFFSYFSKKLTEIKISKALNEYIIGTEAYKTNKSLIIKYSSKKLNIYNDIPLEKKNFKTNKIKPNYTLNKKLKLSNELYRDFSLDNNSMSLFNSIIENKKDKSNNDKNLDDSSKIFCNQNNINININSYKRKNIKKNKGSTINKVKKNKIELKQEKYPLYYYFCGYLYNKINIPKNKKNFLCISQKFYKSFSSFKHIIDISSYLSLHGEHESIKIFLKEKLNAKEIDFLKIGEKNNNRNNLNLTDINNNNLLLNQHYPHFKNK